jgi:hypothetical protein
LAIRGCCNLTTVPTNQNSQIVASRAAGSLAKQAASERLCGGPSIICERRMAKGCRLPHYSPLADGISFSPFRLAWPFLPTMIWSCTAMPSGRRYRRSRVSSAHPPARAKDRRTDDCALKAKFHSGGSCCAARVSCWPIVLQNSQNAVRLISGQRPKQAQVSDQCGLSLVPDFFAGANNQVAVRAKRTLDGRQDQLARSQMTRSELAAMARNPKFA